jgi:hypothetical protein
VTSHNLGDFQLKVNPGIIVLDIDQFSQKRYILDDIALRVNDEIFYESELRRRIILSEKVHPNGEYAFAQLTDRR